MEETKHVHTHSLPDGTVIEHVHEDAGAQGHGHPHSHTHTHTHTKAVLNRLSRSAVWWRMAGTAAKCSYSSRQ